MNRVKAAYFDAMATMPRAVDPFGPEEQPKIDRLPAAAEISPGMSVLEPGCGTGRLTAILADAVGPTGQVLALDISARMIQVCGDRVGERAQVRLLQVFPHFEDKAAALAALVRSLKRGGRLLVVHFANSAVINEIHRAAAGPIQQDRLPEPAEMRGFLSGAGLAVDRCTDDSLGYLVRGVRLGPA
jgi:demethylmenaquinone methyltransferase/2-methoxy-6-polyprenyl-1,4-benzoquinol methylase